MFKITIYKYKNQLINTHDFKMFLITHKRIKFFIKNNALKYN